MKELTIKSLISLLEEVANESDEGLDTPVMALLYPSDKEETGTTVTIQDVGITGYLEGPFCQFDLKISDQAIDRLLWVKDGCK